MSDERYPEGLPWAKVKTLDAVNDRLNRLHEKWDKGVAYCFSATGTSDTDYLGLVTVTLTEPDVWAIAYMITPHEWGKGYATECAKGVLDFAFTSLSPARIWAGADESNQASIRVAEKLGMKRLRSNPQGYKVDSRWIPTTEYQITMDEWSRQNKGMKSNG
ncbi:MAG: GNAT family N-acetyltransferase [Verrucomicrobiota bacterium]